MKPARASTVSCCLESAPSALDVWRAPSSNRSNETNSQGSRGRSLRLTRRATRGCASPAGERRRQTRSRSRPGGGSGMSCSSGSATSARRRRTVSFCVSRDHHDPAVSSRTSRLCATHMGLPWAWAPPADPALSKKLAVFGPDVVLFTGSSAFMTIGCTGDHRSVRAQASLLAPRHPVQFSGRRPFTRGRRPAMRATVAFRSSSASTMCDRSLCSPKRGIRISSC